MKTEYIATTLPGVVKGLSEVLPSILTMEDYSIVCIGTDRSTGDSLGPLVGTYLKEMGYDNIIGDIDNPFHAVNMEERFFDIPHDKTVIAIDACLGKQTEPGSIVMAKGPIKPGSALEKDHLPAIGDYSISGIVNVAGFMEHVVLQNTRLSRVMQMSKMIAQGINRHIKLVDTHRWGA